MKKMILTVVAMMTMMCGFAKTDDYKVEKNVERYDMTCDMRRLAVKLDLTSAQMDAVQVIQDIFNEEMQSAASARGFERRAIVHQAVRKDVEQMHRVLNDKQFQTYMILLGTTLHNKHL